MRRLSAFAIVGASGVPVNAATMWALHAIGIDYLLAAVASTQVAIAWNLLLTEAFVFRDRREHLSMAHRVGRYFTINNLDTLVRIPLLAFLVEMVGIRPAPANLMLIVAASGLKYVLVSKVIYRPAARPFVEQVLPDPAAPPSVASG